jgi:hypothetical protein
MRTQVQQVGERGTGSKFEEHTKKGINTKRRSANHPQTYYQPVLPATHYQSTPQEGRDLPPTPPGTHKTTLSTYPSLLRVF